MPKPCRTLLHRTVPAAIALGLVLGACSSSSGGEAGGDVSLVPEATIESSTSTTTTEAIDTPPPTTPAPAPVGTGSPRDSATRLYDAWHANDPVTAATVAVPGAVDAMWLTQEGDYSLYNDCDSAEFDTSGCLFRGSNGTIQFTMERAGETWIVIEAFYSAP